MKKSEVHFREVENILSILGEKSIFRVSEELFINSTSACTFRTPFGKQARQKMKTLKGKIEIMNKLLWITTLPNLHSAHQKAGQRGAADSEIANANYLILTLFADSTGLALFLLHFLGSID